MDQELSELSKHLVIEGTARIFHLLGEITAKLEIARKQAEDLHAMLSQVPKDFDGDL